MTRLDETALKALAGKVAEDLPELLADGFYAFEPLVNEQAEELVAANSKRVKKWLKKRAEEWVKAKAAELGVEVLMREDTRALAEALAEELPGPFVEEFSDRIVM